MSIVITPASDIPSFGYHNLFRDTSVTVTASSAAPGFDKENAYDWLTYDFWKGTALDASLVIDAGVGNTVSYNYIGIAAHNLGSVGGTLTLQKSSDGISYTTIQSISPSDDSVEFKTFDTETSRFVRVLNSVALAQFGVISVGQRLDFESGLKVGYSPVGLSQKYEVMSNTSYNSQFIGSTRMSSPHSGSVRLENMSSSWVRQNWPGLRDHIESPYPLFFRGESSFDEPQLIWLSGGISGPTYSTPTLMNATISVSGLS